MSESNLVLHHAAITTDNLERLLVFYCQTLGGAEVRRTGWSEDRVRFNRSIGMRNSSGKISLVRFGSQFLELFEFRSPAPRPPGPPADISRPGFTHICFRVADCQSEYRRLRRSGVPFEAEPLTTPSGAVFAYGRDPDGNILEFLELPGSASFPGDPASQSGG